MSPRPTAKSSDDGGGMACLPCCRVSNTAAGAPREDAGRGICLGSTRGPLPPERMTPLDEPREPLRSCRWPGGTAAASSI